MRKLKNGTIVETFTVDVREVYISSHEIEAKDFEEALQLVQDGEGEEVLLEYSHTLDTPTWVVTDESGLMYQYRGTSFITKPGKDET